MREFQWESAVDLALQYHEGQKYGQFPYIKHLQDVDRFVVTRNFKTSHHSEQYINEPLEHRDKLRAVGWLHDILEDTPCTVEDLAAAGICQEVIDAVVLLTKTPGYVHREYLEAIIENPLAREVKTCDSMANMMQNARENNTEGMHKYFHQSKVLMMGTWYERNTE